VSAHGVAVRCWTCGKSHNLRTLAESTEPLPGCCFDSLMEVAHALGLGVISQLPFHIGRVMEKRAEFQDAIADAAILSPNPEVRKAAQQWRNMRAARSKPDEKQA
jgi:hypothetical protein